MTSIVAPVYRNRETLQDFHRRVLLVLGARGDPFEVVYVNDACPEGSGPVLDGLAHDAGRTRVIHLATNIGQHRAILAGLKEVGGDTVVVLDADLQDPPEAIPQLLDALRLGFDAAFAGRRGDYHASVGRRVTSRGFKFLLHAVLGVPADAGGFVAFTRPVAARVVSRASGGVTIAAMVSAAAHRITSVPVPRERRAAGSSAYSTRTRAGLAIRTLFWAVRTRARRARG